MLDIDASIFDVVESGIASDPLGVRAGEPELVEDETDIPMSDGIFGHAGQILIASEDVDDIDAPRDALDRWIDFASVPRLERRIDRDDCVTLQDQIVCDLVRGLVRVR